MMKKLKRLPAIAFGCALALLFSSCATPYKPSNKYVGYSDVQVTSNTFRVGFVGNNCTSVERAHNLALLRAAEVTKAHNFNFFAVIEEDQTLAKHSTTTPASVSTSMHQFVPSHYTVETIYTPPQTNVYTRPISDIFIRCFSENPKGLITYEANSLEQTLRQKYKIKPQKVPPQPASAP